MVASSGNNLALANGGVLTRCHLICPQNRCHSVGHWALHLQPWAEGLAIPRGTGSPATFSYRQAVSIPVMWMHLPGIDTASWAGLGGGAEVEDKLKASRDDWKRVVETTTFGRGICHWWLWWLNHKPVLQSNLIWKQKFPLLLLKLKLL